MRWAAGLLAGAVLLAVGCTDPTAPPRTTLPDSVLVDAMAQLHIASARAARLAEDADSLRAAAYAAAGVDSAEVARALDAYAHRPEALRALTERVVDQLREMHETLEESMRTLPAGEE